MSRSAGTPNNRLERSVNDKLPTVWPSTASARRGHWAVQ